MSVGALLLRSQTSESSCLRIRFGSYFFGRDLHRELNGSVPIGLVASDWGGQAIQVFSSPEALNDSTCGGTVPHFAPATDETVGSGSGSVTAHQTSGAGDVTVGASGDGVTASQLWFAMLSPLRPMRFAGAVW